VQWLLAALPDLQPTERGWEVTPEETLVPELVNAYHRIAAAAECIAEDPKEYETTLSLIHDVLAVCGVPATIDVSRRIRAVATYVEGGVK
jgi:hypothetical protein